MTDQNSILKGRCPQSKPHEKKTTKIHDLTRPGSNLRPIAYEANDVPLRHRGEGLSGRKYWMYMWRISKAEAGIV